MPQSQLKDHTKWLRRPRNLKVVKTAAKKAVKKAAKKMAKKFKTKVDRSNISANSPFSS
jgi:hypothetical protein